MADVEDIQELVKDARDFAISDDGGAQAIRTFDGIAELLVEIIRELREINEKLGDKNNA